MLDFINAAERDAGTYLYGRTMCEMMIGWETDPAVAGSLPLAAVVVVVSSIGADDSFAQTDFTNGSTKG